MNRAYRFVSYRVKTLTLISTVVLLIGLLMSIATGVSFGQDGLSLKPRVIFSKPGHTVIDEAHRADRVIVKFQEGTRIRERSGQLVALVDVLSGAEEKQLGRVHLTKEQVREQIKTVNRLLKSKPGLHWERLFPRPESELEREKREGEQNSGEELADLSLYYGIHLDRAVAPDTETLMDQLNALDLVETAYPEPIPTPAECRDIAPPTPTYIDRQGYLNPAPNGINARYAWTVAGGRGDGVRIIDVEGGWNLTHENLPDVFFQAGENSTNPTWRQHGTGTMGEMVGCGIDPNDGREYGVTGIVNQASFGISSIFPSGSYPPAINTAAAQLNAGEIILIELQSNGPACNQTCNCTGTGLIPAEYDQAVFDVIRATTARGILVVQAAANGANNLDCPAYGSRFDRSVRDSGAILVGAGSANGRVPMNFTNYGSRVDLHGWGEAVMTAGYGDIRVNGDDQNQWYTAVFNGTSSASPIVIGAVASVQGALLAQGLPPLQPTDMLNLLQATGTPQAQDPRQIGPLPNLQDALTILLPGALAP